MKKITQVMPFIGNEELALITESIEARWLTEGPNAAAFLEHIRDYTGCKYVVLAPNGTLGLHLALLALDLPAGSEIIIPSFTFFGSASSAVFANLVPVFVDVDPETFNIDPARLEQAITPNTRAIMPVHVYGHSANMDAVMDVAARHGLKVIEDAAQAYGVIYKGRHCGTIGDIGVISFFADKTITMGEGAVVMTNDEATYTRLRYLRNQGRENSGTFIHDALGMNYRITDIQAATGLAQARKFPAVEKHKQTIHALYRELLEGVGDLSFLRVEDGSNLIPFRFCLRTAHREGLAAALDAAGVQTRSFFYPMHRQPPLEKYHRATNDMAVSERLYEEGLLLPVHIEVSEEDVHYMCDVVRRFFDQA
ncbi:MAG: DegT/DnrJ/EryC1/StrS family aminotransferase [Rhodobacteraceae bacterium]|nr:DegT/DnrJ/EryC1/StrS family aminotransferase [Paracoccaceae bacterium]